MTRISKSFLLSLTNFESQTYRFEIVAINDEKLTISMYDLKDRKTVYEDEYDYPGICKVFEVLPEKCAKDLISVIHYQVFICGLINKKKVEVHLSRNNCIRVELTDVADAPKGAEYNVSIILPKLK